MSIKTKKRFVTEGMTFVGNAEKKKLGVYKNHPFGQPSPVKKEGRMTPNGKVHMYVTKIVLGKKTNIPAGRIWPV